MSGTPRTPPRFVPTLTTVVEVAPEPPSAAEVPTQPGALQGAPMGNNMLEDLHFAPAPPLAPSGPQRGAGMQAAGSANTAVPLSDEEAFRLEEQLLHRVLQRVDLSLEERLTDTVSLAVQRQLDAMMPLLRSEIETVLRSLVVEALAQELSETPGSGRPWTPPSLG